jgi:hypothetical protein
MEKNIFEAARAGDEKRVKICLEEGVDLVAKNEYGFTALHCAAMGCNAADGISALVVINLLLNAGSLVNATSNDGRTALYLAAEFSPTIEPLKVLIDAGAEADIRDAHGNHIVTNAMTEEVQEFLSRLTGHPIPQPPLQLESVKLSIGEWRSAKVQLDKVFDALTQEGLIVMQDAGTTQEDGFSDCAEEFGSRAAANLSGFCFYTRQDLNRAKRTSQLPLAFWGAPEGAPQAMLHVSRQIVFAFRQNGFLVDWSGSPSMRPIIYLQNIGQTHG